MADHRGIVARGVVPRGKWEGAAVADLATSDLSFLLRDYRGTPLARAIHEELRRRVRAANGAQHRRRRAVL